MLLSFFCFGIAVNIRAEEESTIVPSAQELRLLELINEARRSPLDIAVSLGMDREQILRDLPEMNSILINGMEPLKLNEDLGITAAAHNNDMFARNYYSSASPEGICFEDRISGKSDQRVLLTGESLGMVSFKNFMNPDDAVSVIFENMLRDELNPQRVEKRNILNPDLQEIGISFKSGKLNFGDEKRNIYLIVCDFAIFLYPEKVEQLLYDAVNEVRSNSDNSVVYNAPLAINDCLTDAAKGHMADMRGNIFFSHNSLDGKTALDRVYDYGYKSVYLNEVIGAFIFDGFMDPMKGARILLDRMISDNIEKNVGRWGIFDPSLTDMGIAFDAIFIKTGEGMFMGIYLMVCDFGYEHSVFSGGSVRQDLSDFCIFAE